MGLDRTLPGAIALDDRPGRQHRRKGEADEGADREEAEPAVAAPRVLACARARRAPRRAGSSSRARRRRARRGRSPSGRLSSVRRMRWFARVADDRPDLAPRARPRTAARSEASCAIFVPDGVTRWSKRRAAISRCSGVERLDRPLEMIGDDLARAAERVERLGPQRRRAARRARRPRGAASRAGGTAPRSRVRAVLLDRAEPARARARSGPRRRRRARARRARPRRRRPRPRARSSARAAGGSPRGPRSVEAVEAQDVAEQVRDPRP